MQISSKIRRLLAKNITGFNARCCWPLINHKAENKKNQVRIYCFEIMLVGRINKIGDRSWHHSIVYYMELFAPSRSVLVA